MLQEPQFEYKVSSYPNSRNSQIDSADIKWQQMHIQVNYDWFEGDTYIHIITPKGMLTIECDADGTFYMPENHIPIKNR